MPQIEGCDRIKACGLWTEVHLTPNSIIGLSTPLDEKGALGTYHRKTSGENKCRASGTSDGGVC